MSSAALQELQPHITDLITRDQVKIPPYPGVAMKLQALVSSGNYGMGDLVKIVSGDQVLAAALLRVANSAAYKATSQISSVPDAVSRLGSGEVVKLALATTVGAESSRKGPLTELRRRAWQESLVAAFVSFQLAHARKLNAQEGFVCGLLHDFGRVVAVSTIETLLAQNKDQRARSEADWVEIVDHFHVELGLVVAARWKLSDLLQAVISAHHKPELSGLHRPMVDVVMAADAVVAVLQSRPDVTIADLGALPLLSKAEATLILAAIPQIAPFVASLDEATPQPPGPEVKSQVEKPPTLLKEPVRDSVEIPVALLRQGKETAGKCKAISFQGIAFNLGEKIAENYLAKLRIKAPSMQPFDVHAQVLRCAQVGGGFDVETKLFALDGPAKDAWRKLLTDIGLASTPKPAAAAS
jgi:HD-like signal output (HDOD) protein